MVTNAAVRQFSADACVEYVLELVFSNGTIRKLKTSFRRMQASTTP
ncbi:MAG: hypothetical protein ACXQTZ_03935 [Candidatus Alkanophagales archaeon]